MAPKQLVPRRGAGRGLAPWHLFCLQIVTDLLAIRTTIKCCMQMGAEARIRVSAAEGISTGAAPAVRSRHVTTRHVARRGRAPPRRAVTHRLVPASKSASTTGCGVAPSGALQRARLAASRSGRQSERGRAAPPPPPVGPLPARCDRLLLCETILLLWSFVSIRASAL